MRNTERIVTAIKDIERFLKELEDMKIEKSSDLDDARNFHASSMLCLAVINRAIDIGSEILVAERVSMPVSYRAIFRSLTKERMIDKTLGRDMQELAGHRNFLAHEYFGLDKRRLQRILKKINSVKGFLKAVRQHLGTGLRNHEEPGR